MVTCIALTACLAISPPAPLRAVIDQRMAALVVNLADPDYATRESAERELRAVGMLTLPHVVRARKDGNPERSRRAESLLTTLRAKACPLVHDLRADPPVRLECVRFSPDGKYVAAGGENAVVVWDVATGMIVKRIRSENVYALEFVPGETALWVGGNWVFFNGKPKAQGGTVWRVNWVSDKADVVAHELSKTIVTDLRLTRDGKYLIAAARHQVFVLDPATGKPIHTIPIKPHLVHRLALSPDGRTVMAACADRTMAFIDYRDGKLVRESVIPGTKGWRWQGEVMSCAYSPDGKTIATAATLSEDDGGKSYSMDLIQTWNFDGTPVREFKVFGNTTRRVDFTPDGKFLIAVGSDNDGKDRIITSPRSKILTRYPVDKIAVWNPGSGRAVTQYWVESDDTWVSDLAVSECAGTFAVCCYDKIRLYRLPHPTWADLP